MTELYRGLDPELCRGLDREVAEVLAAWAELHRRHYVLDRWLVNGRSRQAVAVVSETDTRDARNPRTTMLVLKVLSSPSDSVQTIEYARHHQAESERPDFARRHLSTFVHDAVPVSARQWITFQRIAANNLENTEVLTVLLRRMLHPEERVDTPKHREIVCRPETFVDACRSIVAGVLGDWAGAPFIPPAAGWDLKTFFGWHLFDQLEPGGRLAGWASDHDTELIRVEGEPGPLPNPFAVARGRVLADARIRPVVGRSHGDLHTDNALVRVRPQVDTDDWFLIDTALYDSVGPLTRDPVHLLLYVIARSMGDIAPSQQGALIDLLLDPIDGPSHLVPTWLADLVRGVGAESGAWVERSGLAHLWREQTYLSLAACAMLFLGRTSTRDQDKSWFLRLAARAVARFAAERGVSVEGTTGDSAPQVVRAANAAKPAVPQSDPEVESEPEAREKKPRRQARGAEQPKYAVKIRESKGSLIGDDGRQINKF
ncbi:hypothetical protein ABZ319_00255 [Nocardia sp. NPDC005978]|uniref:hypothetical protein n=1 Tax=Nocardia sp. NPDC005978 TaxID=3156725 RepID=UPI0033B610DA